MRRAAAVAAMALSAASPASAGDYPFSGFFAANFNRMSAQQVELTCAFGFFVQEKNGTFINYHLDLPRYFQDKSVRYLEYARGHCHADTEQRIETCVVTSDTDPTQVGKVFVDVFQVVVPEAIVVRFFDDANQAAAFVRDGTTGDSKPAEYDMCPGFDSASMADYLSAERSTLPLGERKAIESPQLDADNMAIMTRVLETIRAGKKE